MPNDEQSQSITQQTESAQPIEGNQVAPDASQLSSDSSAPHAEPPARELPDKFRGKSVEDVVEMYQNLERQSGKSASELGSWKERHEELMSRIRQLESERTPKQPEADPEKLFEREVAENPSEAIKNLVKRTQERIQRELQGVHASVQQETAREYVQSQLRDNPDFKENFDTMVELEKQYGAFVRPELAGTKVAYQLLYDLARAKNINRYVEKARASANQTRNEKRAATSESASSSRGHSEEKPFDSLDLKEMERLLGRASRE